MKKLKIRIAFIIGISCFLFSCGKEDIKPSQCQLIPDAGDCRAIIVKYYYDQEEGKCKPFNWGGCGGVVPFETLESCLECECD